MELLAMQIVALVTLFCVAVMVSMVVELNMHITINGRPFKFNLVPYAMAVPIVSLAFWMFV